MSAHAHTSLPHPFYSLDPALTNFFGAVVSLDEKSPQRETLCKCGRGKTKNNCRSTKSWSKMMRSKTVLSSGKFFSIGLMHQMESALKVNEVYM